jgi:hypothetical protein
MKKDYTHITVLLDRTGSMESIREDTIGGFNAFLKKQKDEPGKATLSLIQFDSQDPYEVIHQFQPIKEVPELTHETYVPRAQTPLLDAMGRGINDLEKSIGKLKKKEHPSKVVMVIVTDGQENASREFRKDQVEKMIKEKTEKDLWEFVFLSADLAAIGDARELGMYSSKMLLFRKTSQGSADAWASLSENTSNFRANRKSGVDFEPSDRKHPEDPANR